MRGSSMDYPGEALAALGNVVVVTLNYRLGIFGFFVSKDSDIPANLGLWDQHTALLWVKENIAEFGGDPSSVTLFGQSAGASSIIYQMFSSRNDRTVFQKAIVESSWNNYLGEVNRDVDAFNDRQILLLGCGNQSSLVTCMRGKPTKELVTRTLRGFSLLPYADGDFLNKNLGNSLVRNSLNKDRLRSDIVGNFYDYDLMAGWNSDEGTLFLGLLSQIFPDPTALNKEKLMGLIMKVLFPGDDGSYLSTSSVASQLTTTYFSDISHWTTNGMPEYTNILEAVKRMFGEHLKNVFEIEIRVRLLAIGTY